MGDINFSTKLKQIYYVLEFRIIYLKSTKWIFTSVNYTVILKFYVLNNKMFILFK